MRAGGAGATGGMPDPCRPPYLLRGGPKESKHDLMTEAATRAATRVAEPVTIRPYRPLDHRACWDLWAELIDTKRELYQDPTIGGTDPGAGFEEYLTRLDLAGIWVAEHRNDGVVGLVGLVLSGLRAGVGGPLVVAQGWRGRGIGRALLRHAASAA